jgi:hypothetical protein
MNTNDIRNMGSNQWVFWASAVPLTLFVIGLSLYLAGQQMPVQRWMWRTATSFKFGVKRPHRPRLWVSKSVPRKQVDNAPTSHQEVV